MFPQTLACGQSLLNQRQARQFLYHFLPVPPVFRRTRRASLFLVFVTVVLGCVCQSWSIFPCSVCRSCNAVRASSTVRGGCACQSYFPAIKSTPFPGMVCAITTVGRRD